MMIHRENLIAALHVAITERRRIEKAHGYTSDSGLVAGWVELVAVLQSRTEELTFFPLTS
jgi:hypothetical protein